MPPASRRWTSFTIAYHGVLFGRIALIAVAWVLGAIHLDVPGFAGLHAGLQVSAFAVCVAIGLMWLHRAWGKVPAACRRAYDGRRIEPAEAVWKLFVPIYDVYWMFLTNIGLCGAVERHLARGGARSHKAPSNLAFAACIVQLVPVANLIVSPFLWAFFMVQVDAAQAEAERLDPAPPPADLGLWKTLGLIAGGVVLTWGLLTLAYVAVWQFLSPAAPAGP